MKHWMLYLLFLLEITLPTTLSIKWLSLATINAVSTIDTKQSCAQLRDLAKRQQVICKRNLEVMESVKEGAKLAIHECQYQFIARRWNCSTVNPQSVFGNVLNQGTREASFVHAISAAGVSFAVTRACSTGELTQCGCDRSLRGQSPDGFKWSGCSDNIAYGSAFSRNFVDAKERAKGANADRALMNLHNNQAGRMLLENNVRVQCKCHGVSGSCEVKTCWRSLPTFRETGNLIKEKFDGASEVTHRVHSGRQVLVPVNPKYKHQSAEDLVYLVASPDFCSRDLRIGSLGTEGRRCNADSKAIDGCELMCCGRGYETTRRIVEERCRCKFQWCCEVKCQICRREVEEHRCL